MSNRAQRRHPKTTIDQPLQVRIGTNQTRHLVVMEFDRKVNNVTWNVDAAKQIIEHLEIAIKLAQEAPPQEPANG